MTWLHWLPSPVVKFFADPLYHSKHKDKLQPSILKPKPAMNQWLETPGFCRLLLESEFQNLQTRAIGFANLGALELRRESRGSQSASSLSRTPAPTPSAWHLDKGRAPQALNSLHGSRLIGVSSNGKPANMGFMFFASCFPMKSYHKKTG